MSKAKITPFVDTSLEDPRRKELYMGIEDIVYAWSLEGAPIDNLMEAIYDYVLETFGPPF